MTQAPYTSAIVTGASGGIGEALSLMLAERGVKVALIARRGTVLEALADRIKREGGQALAIPCDVALAKEVTAAVAEAKLRHGPPGLVIANAGIGWNRPSAEWDPDESLRLYRVNVMGALHLAYAALPFMLAEGRGRIAAISSLASYQGVPTKGDYCGSKAAMRVHFEALRAELRPKGITVTTVCPGFIRTPMTDRYDFDLPYLMEPVEASHRILKAIDRGKREVRFPWPMSMAVRLGGMLPRFLYDRVVGKERKRKPRTQPKSTHD